MKKIYVVNGATHKGYGEETARTIIKNGHKVIDLYEKENSKNADKLTKEFAESELQLMLIDMDNVNNFDYALTEKIFRCNYHYPMMMAIELKKKMKKRLVNSNCYEYRGRKGFLWRNYICCN